MKNENCKGCSASVRIKEQDFKFEMFDQKQLVNDDEYERRLRICEKCSEFEYGTTCLQCGCVMQFKAKFKKSNCPYPGGEKW